MTIRGVLLLLAAAASLGAQTFIQMSDPQFGMFEKDAGFAHETANFEFAIAAANRIQPAFVMVTGDLTNKPGDAAQIAEFHRIAGKLDSRIRLYTVPGNHDVGNEPTAASLAAYRKNYGKDYYSFRAGEIYGIVLNSNLEKGTKDVPAEAAKMEAWFRAELGTAKRSGAKHIIVFQHIPLFMKESGEPDQYFNIEADVRARYLKLMHEYGVKEVFAGHYHRNELGRDGDLEMVTTGPVGTPLGGARSGIRVVTVDDKGVSHRYYDFGDLP
ncbi:MAG: metallophosphoesterase [Acidobacteria bacterium]|nr:metallophosphoesterase [Acidobacteriota bacterium]